ncbi:hypothetical protein ACQ4PT_026998 [Festuca glaucescens]
MIDADASETGGQSAGGGRGRRRWGAARAADGDVELRRWGAARAGRSEGEVAVGGGVLHGQPAATLTCGSGRERSQGERLCGFVAHMRRALSGQGKRAGVGMGGGGGRARCARGSALVAMRGLSRIDVEATEEMAAINTSNSSVSVDVEKSEEVSGKDIPASRIDKSPVSMDEEELDLNVESTTVDDFDNRPLKKTKSSKTCVSDDPLSSLTISTTSIVSECSDSVSSELMNEEPLPPSPNKLALSPVSAEDDKHIINNLTYDYHPEDYTLTQLDECAHCVIQYSKEDDILVKIDDISIKKRYLECLLDDRKWLDNEVISGYICCLREQAHVQNKNDAKIYFENPFVTRLLKQDGESGIDRPTGMTKVVENYLEHDMIHLPINIKDTHWYFASINLQTCDIHVLDSLCWKNSRSDLTLMLQGIQYHLDILKGQGKLDNYRWKDIDVTKWRITEHLEKPIQKDSSSCGLFLLKFMEYWTGNALSHPITQEIISSFRAKLAAILLCWKNNTAPPTTMIEENDDSSGDPDDVIMSDKPFVQNQSKDNNSVSIENKYQSLMSVLSNLSMHELVGGLCNYIKSINSPEALEEVWVQSSKPYPISLTVRTLQGVLNNELPMDRDCFNLVVRKIMFDDIHMVKRSRGLISKHCLDMQFWMITDFGQHPNYRKKLDVEQLAYSVCSWPGIKYNVSSCKSGTVWLFCYPLHVHMERGKSAFAFFKGRIRTQETHFGTTPNNHGE